ncbi:(d)CMP kinase [Mycoplasmopsis agassizii]|uniref:Cytidylate kinase n=1 Tax=Mycoplasmopsis agassizii TaxID=33922 RepID=A0ABX4H411_9BACT|nr:(d)CMP kinase [Mycoplasmopsis agassizii]PAF54625.1 (d)CMP kinase [Mycoplasmopsis agassizii]SMC16326.1 cytidylate kinase [Mycoplasmopsis agassizii]
MKKINIAIDGPSGAGKSSISKILATQLNYVFINTGSFYRALAYEMMKKNWSVEELIKELANLNFLYENDEHLFLNGVNYSEFLRDPAISQKASEISKHAEIRNHVNNYITNLVKHNKGYILEGRDTTFKVAPNAELRLFMQASPDVRALRRTLQNETIGIHKDFKKVLEEVNFRDMQDSTREVDPLHIAEGVIVLDNSSLTFDETVTKILELVNEKISGK